MSTLTVEDAGPVQMEAPGVVEQPQPGHAFAEGRVVTIFEQAPDTGVERAYHRQRTEVGKLFMAWTDKELAERGFPEAAVAVLRSLDMARAVIDAGWHASQVDLNAAALTLSPGPPPRRM